ncbi:nucleotide exchange factor GrpE [Bartonella sp. DGB2]|uniref:nucleotide exchange factor GrpE n=1 Tax=Bartonella sp. DGB2 TaxID=3388426 RepID=UPI00398FEFE2
MSEKNTPAETESFNNHTITNPADREALKKAADDYLKKQKPSANPESEMEINEDQVNPAAALAEENAALKDQLLRLAADMENLRRCTTRDVTNARTYAISNFARDMLSVADDLERALAAIPDGARENEAGLKALAEGVEMTSRTLLATLERYGVKKITPDGQKFDPNFHQAMFEVEDPNLPNNSVCQVVQAGYIINERVLRPALVGVVKSNTKEGDSKA